MSQAMDTSMDPAHSLNPSLVDGVLTEHFGMPMSSMAANYAPIGGHASQPVAANDPQHAQASDEDAELEHELAAVAGMTSPSSDQVSAHDEMADSGFDELETVLVGWVEGMEDTDKVERIPVEVDESVPSPVPDELNQPQWMDEPTYVVANYHPTLIDGIDREEDSSSTSWYLVGGVVVAIAAGAGAWLFERASQKKQTQESLAT